MFRKLVALLNPTEEGGGSATLEAPAGEMKEFVYDAPSDMNEMLDFAGENAENTEKTEAKAEETSEEKEKTPSAEGKVETTASEPTAESWQSERTELLKKLEELSAAALGAKPAEDAEKPAAAAEAKPEKAKDRVFLSEDEAMSLITEPGKMNAKLQEVYSAAREDVLRELPTVVDHLVTHTLYVRETVNTFYAANEDLRAHKNYVGMEIQKIQQANPKFTLEQCANAALPVIRARIPAPAGSEKKKETPALPGKGGSQGAAKAPKTTNALADEIDKFLGDLD